jgi:hypothetical protein
MLSSRSRTRFRLSESDFPRYTRKERELFRLIPRAPRRVNSTELAIAIVADSPQRDRVWPNDQLQTSAALRSLRQKINVNKEPFRLCSTRRMGPHPMEYWLEAR